MQSEVALDLRGGDLGSTGEVDNLAEVLQVLEAIAALPIGAHHDRVDVILAHILRLLLPARLGNDEVNIADGLEQLLALLVGEVALLALSTVELVGGEGDHKIVTQRLCAAQQVDVAVVEEIESSVGENALHGCPRVEGLLLEQP